MTPNESTWRVTDRSGKKCRRPGTIRPLGRFASRAGPATVGTSTVHGLDACLSLTLAGAGFFLMILGRLGGGLRRAGWARGAWC